LVPKRKHCHCHTHTCKHAAIKKKAFLNKGRNYGRITYNSLFKVDEREFGDTADPFNHGIATTTLPTPKMKGNK
jgi:hypothetical protein